MIDNNFEKLLKILHKIVLEYIPANWETTMQLSRSKSGLIMEAVLYMKDSENSFFKGYYFGRMEEERNKDHLRLLMNQLGYQELASDSSLYRGVERALRALKSK